MPAKTPVDAVGRTRRPTWFGPPGHTLPGWLMGCAVFVSLAISARHPPFGAAASGLFRIGAPEAIGLAALCGLAGASARSRRWPLYLTAAAGWVALSMWLPAVLAMYYTGTGRYRAITAGTPGAWLRRPLAAPVVGSIGVVLVAVPESMANHSAVSGVLVAALMIALPLTLGLWVGARREMWVALRERAERLEREQHAQAEQARAEERARIAHEMHDVLAHQVALIVLHAGALEVTSDDPQTVAVAELIRSTGRQALADLRQVLGVLRAETEGGRGMVGEPDPTLAPPPTLADLDRLLASTRAAGISVVRHDEGDPGPLPAAVGRAAYRVVQEALTNVARHAWSAPTTVRIVHEPGALGITVRNERPATPLAGATAGSGFGLIGLRERLGLLGGRCEAGPTADGGFAVHATLPDGTSAEPGDPTDPSPAGGQP